MKEPKHLKRALSKPSDPVDRRDVPGLGTLTSAPPEPERKPKPHPTPKPTAEKGGAP
jgi:hypothetical protein